jgi:rRNA biogenesis protein RRP5
VDPDLGSGVEPLSKRAKKRAREEHEAAVHAAEQAKLGENTPASADDFERLLLGSPSSSYVWIRYMSFYLQSSEVDQARAVAERALTKIDLR